MNSTDDDATSANIKAPIGGETNFETFKLNSMEFRHMLRK